jgi:hypothetical protein
LDGEMKLDTFRLLIFHHGDSTVQRYIGDSIVFKWTRS